MKTCPRCGEKNSDRARFCQGCAASLEDDRERRELRKTVTVLFTDMTGSTALGERLDPEALRAVMTRYYDEMKRVVESHGGTVQKFIGDAVVAVFGVPEVHEDDALRAVRAAVEMRVALERLNDELEETRGVRIRTRTGINTGEIVASEPDPYQTLVTGDTANVAARLEQAAPPGEILVGEPTYRLVRHAIRAERVDPIEAKGKSRPVPAMRLLDVSPGATAVPRRLEAPLVGRDEQLRMLHDAYAEVIARRSCRLITVLGSAGVGKSRLAQEFALSAEGALVLGGRCPSYGQGMTFFPVSEVVKEAAGIKDEMLQAAKERIRSVLGEEVEAPAVAERLGELVRLQTEGAAAAEDLFWAFRKFVEALARRSTIVLVFDDIQWGESTFLDLIEHVADWSRDAPILLICLARPELLEARPGWAAGRGNATALLLEPLSDEHTRVLMSNLVEGAELDAKMEARIAEVADGNPLFVEEIVGMLRDDGILTRVDGRWTARWDLADVPVPPTVQALIAARLGRLPPRERIVMERASVEGTVFHAGTVSHLTPGQDRAELPALLRSLARRNMIRAVAPELAGEREAYRFRHQLIRDAAYRSVGKQARAGLHERLAAWLEGATGDREDEYSEVIGYHLEQAHRCLIDLGPRGDRARTLGVLASRRLASSGRRALARADVPAAANLLSRASALLEEEDPERMDLLPDLGRALHLAGETSRADAVLTETAEWAGRIGAEALEWWALVERSSIRVGTDPEAAASDLVESVAKEAISVFERLGDQRRLVTAWRLLADVHSIRGDCAGQLAASEEAMEHAQRSGDRHEASETAGWISATMLQGATPLEEAIARCRSFLGDLDAYPQAEAFVLCNLGQALAMRKEFLEARGLLSRAVAAAEDLGRPLVLAAMYWFSGAVEQLAGDPGAAEAHYRSALELFQRAGDRGYMSSLVVDLARVLCEQGRIDEALTFTEMSAQTAAAEDVVSQAGWRSVRANALARQGKLAEAERMAREAVRLAEATDMLNFRADTWLDLANVLSKAARGNKSTRSIRAALALYERKGNLVGAERARSALASVPAGQTLPGSSPSGAPG